MILRPTYTDRIVAVLDTPVIKVLTGMRRCGKSTILRLLAQELAARGVPATNVVHLDFESLAIEDLTTYPALYRAVRDRAEATAGRIYILLDEIQRVAGWEKAVASFQVDFDCDIVITGSNASLLSSDLATHIAGRYLEFRVRPLSFREFLDFAQQSQSREDLGVADQLTEYLRFGGMPGLTELPPDESVRYAYLTDVFATVVLKDVVARYGIRDVDLLERLVAFTLSNLGHTFSAKRVADFLKGQRRGLGVETVYRYLRALSEAFVLNRVRRFDIKGKRFLETQEKYFVEDHGFRHALLGYRADDIPGVLENVVFAELVRRGYSVHIGTVGAAEVDFVAELRDTRLYVQVAYLLADDAVRTREFGPLAAIRDNHRKLVVSLDPIPATNHDGIERLPLADFLLTDAW